MFQRWSGYVLNGRREPDSDTRCARAAAPLMLLSILLFNRFRGGMSVGDG
jgi:hypothetical protein